jgi:hypothetical protein
MPLGFVIDEHLRGALLQAIHTHNARGGSFIDAVQVGDPDDLPLGSPDPDILSWAERAGRIVISQDYSTMRVHFDTHLQAARHSPGLLLLAPGSRLQAVVNMLEVIAHAGSPDDFLDQIYYIP